MDGEGKDCSRMGYLFFVRAKAGRRSSGALMHHKRRRPIRQRAGCWCKWGKKNGEHELRGKKVKGRASRLRLAERSRG